MPVTNRANSLDDVRRNNVSTGREMNQNNTDRSNRFQTPKEIIRSERTQIDPNSPKQLSNPNRDVNEDKRRMDQQRFETERTRNLQNENRGNQRNIENQQGRFDQQGRIDQNRQNEQRRLQEQSRQEIQQRGSERQYNNRNVVEPQRNNYQPAENAPRQERRIEQRPVQRELPQRNEPRYETPQRQERRIEQRPVQREQPQRNEPRYEAPQRQERSEPRYQAPARQETRSYESPRSNSPASTPSVGGGRRR